MFLFVHIIESKDLGEGIWDIFLCHYNLENKYIWYKSDYEWYMNNALSKTLQWR